MLLSEEKMNLLHLHLSGRIIRRNLVLQSIVCKKMYEAFKAIQRRLNSRATSLDKITWRVEGEGGCVSR